MKFFIMIFVSVLLTCCYKEDSTLYYAYMKNTTSHRIEIKPYFAGSVPINKIITLVANDTKEIATGFDRGIVGNAGFNSSYLSGSDSIIVVFDNLYSITHYFSSPAVHTPKYYFLTSNRNIYNKDNYVYTYQDLSKHQRKSTYNYEFKEQDYLDAR
jgi:hypothetical protein